MTSISYQAAVDAAEGAYLAAGVWADEVRQAAEARMGVGPADERALDDPDYARAVTVMGPANELKRLLDDLRDLAERTVAAEYRLRASR